MKEKTTAIVLAAGQGKRMHSKIQKQFLEIQGHPVLYYSLKCFQESPLIHDIIIVTGEDMISYCKREIVERYQLTKVSAVIAGGKERYDSVYKGLLACEECKYVFIHDGARMFVDEAMLERGYNTVEEYKACVAGMPSKDTIKLVNDFCQAVDTPDRKYVWAVQTPQIFERELITEAYARLMETDDVYVTDDAMVVEQMMKLPVKLFEGSYTNIKLTTPEDLDIARVFLHI